MKSGAVSRILVVKPSSLGDILHVFPALQLLRKHFPCAELDFLINPEFDALLDYSPFPVRRRIHFERRKLAGLLSGPAEFFKLVRALRRERYDLVVDFQGLFRSAFFAWIARHRAGAVCGFAAPREKAARFFYARRAAVKTMHAVEKNVELADFAAGSGEKVPDVEIPPPAVPSPVAERMRKPFVVVFPGARWPSKCFPAELFSGIMRRIGTAAPETAFILAGSGTDAPRAAAVLEKLPEGFP